MQIPYISPLNPTGDHSPSREHYGTCLHLYVLLKNTKVSNAPPFGQQIASKSPHKPHPNLCWGVTMIGA